ncbi:hypothetical protein FR483_n437L [Paramecium bursaria Chlorella virus FR483]|uniref:Uncharacterized protein n437L n=1 Tax=Paramecium bursaria Chlorella virus FR483 TaxID=399781 RepID=A7J7E1_PBCVF|nr:hypothetical protein FR483_n437L [Paramecium bursaria Chlorella virus FR483]ABT15722.1 hypothetical protein FR483_n437L [Paramecium bursaria Chlorella virus FR483]
MDILRSVNMYLFSRSSAPPTSLLPSNTRGNVSTRGIRNLCSLIFAFRSSTSLQVTVVKEILFLRRHLRALVQCGQPRF